MNETTSPLGQLLQPNQFIGWTCRLDYEQAVILTCDAWKTQAGGVPQHCFLLAAAADPQKNPGGDTGEIILLRVTGAALPGKAF